jgi:thioester reductase-like protein
MGGEKLPAVEPSGISYTIANGYGPTENCCGVSIFPIKEWEPNIPIGKPIATIHGYVLDKTNHRLPAGAAGEYCLSGPQVSRGYLNRPEKTAEAYENSPFDEFRMYHTGDIVRYRQSGDIEFVGRKDGQVKIRGFRIETKEVEAVIRGYESIKDVTVQAYDYEGGGKYLAAFVVSEDTVDTAALAEYIKSQKPAYMCPAVIMQIDKIPLTINQKVDKKALPKPEQKKADYVAPATKTEEDFCNIFGSVLDIKRVSAEDDFFEIGGSSILAMKVVIAAEKAGYKIVYNDVFTYTTPKAMAEFLGDTSEKTIKTEAPAVYGDWTPPITGRDGYDYTKIHELLSKNTLEAFRNGELNTIGDVLLLGATGYLGSHVLRELIENYDGEIYCFVRPGKEQSGEQRLKSTLRHYFDYDYEWLFGSRLNVIEGDATDPSALAAFEAPRGGMTAINCAASVKHFAKGNEIDRVNVESVKNLTSWCENNNARLVHISTGSIMGSRENGLPPVSYKFTENVLYAGQELNSNQYIHSKFMAERHIYEEVIERGLKATVCRVGNLAPRFEDGEFQINYATNNYMRSLNAYKTIGLISYDALNVQTEFSPIDYVAKAALALAKTPDDCVCFQPLNPHRPLMGDVIRSMNDIGFSIRGGENEEVAEALNTALADENKSSAVGSLIAYNSGDSIQMIGLESLDNDYTSRVLERLGFSWPETDSEYIRRFLKKLDEKGFFGGND